MKVQKSRLEGLIALLLFGVFAVCLMMVLLTGAGSYHRLTQRDQAAYDRRTCIQYIATQVRQADCEGCISVEPFGDVQALALEETIDREAYVTRIYLWEGYLMELFSARSVSLFPEDGTKIMPVREAQFSLEAGKLTVTCVDEQGAETSLTLAMRSGKGETG